MKNKCKHKECKKAKEKLCANGHEDCIWYGCNDKLHKMANGPGGWIPGSESIGNTD